MSKGFITTNSRQTSKLGEMLAKEIKSGPASTRGDDRSSRRGGEIICLTGDLGSGKTTFTQGFLKGLGAKGPFTSPTFVIMKKYQNVYHIDAYRVKSDDILNLGWEEIISDSRNIVIIEWADRVSDIIPKASLWINFEWVDENKRKIKLKSSNEK